MRLIDRREPLRTALTGMIAAALAIELCLLLAGRWILVRSYEYTNSDAGDAPLFQPATRQWRVLDCKYWTGRSIQEVTVGNEFTEAPRECPFISRAI